jgi:hypothetical protein
MAIEALAFAASPEALKLPFFVISSLVVHVTFREITLPIQRSFFYDQISDPPR